MSQRPARASGMPWLSPYLTVHDPAAALDFYQRAFGFSTRMEMKDAEGKIKHAEMAWQEAVIMLGPACNQDGFNRQPPATSGHPVPLGLYVYCENVDALHERATKAGAKSLMAPETMFWGDRMCTVLDPDGYMWSFATNVADFDPSKAPK